MMDQKYLAEIKARERAATPGPWKRGIGNEFREISTDTGLLLATARNPNDGDFIAHARTDIPALLAEVERLQTEVVKKELAFGQLTHYNAAKDQQIATLEKALELKCEDQSDVERMIEYAKQAQEQEGKE